MAAVSDRQIEPRYREINTPPDHSGAIFGKQIRPLELEDYCDRFGIVYASTFSGFCVGSSMGGLACGAGAVPGAIIGATVGFMSSVAACRRDDNNRYKAYRKRLSEQGRLILKECLQKKIGADELCAITREVASLPVQIRGEEQIYEAEALKNWIRRSGKSFMSGRPCTLKDIIISYDQLARNIYACDALLTDPVEKAQLSDFQIKGVCILREQTLEFAKNVYNRNLNLLNQNRKQGKITQQEFEEETAKLDAFANPLIGDAALAMRH